MPDTAMASPRRAAGEMRLSVLDALATETRPMTGVELIERLGRGGRRVYNSQVFRTLDQLCRSGQIRKIAHRSAYAIGSASGLASLVCCRCGTLQEVEVESAFAELDALAHRLDFTVSRYFVEIPGICRGCGEAAPGADA